MKEFIISLLMTLGVISPFYGVEPPEVNTEGLIQREIVISETPVNIPELFFTEEDVVIVAKTLYGECRGCPVEEQAKVAWCILNRVDDPRFPNTIFGVITQPHQFHGYCEMFPVTNELYAVALDVLTRWSHEKQGIAVERELTPEYVYFTGNGQQNIFRTEY